MTISSCTVQKVTSDNGCDGHKVVRNETVGTLSYGVSNGMLFGVTLESQGIIVPDMDVVVLDSIGKQITGVTSGTLGDYRISLEPGTYQVRFSRVGYCTILLKDIVIGRGDTRELVVIIPVKTSH